jgi:quercetin dioxygenase-like cupin family protein
VPQPRKNRCLDLRDRSGRHTARAQHLFVRYAYVLTGRLRVTNTETGHSNIYKAGDFIIEAIGQWHQAVNLDDRPLKLLVIDQQADEKSNVVVRK